MLIFLTIYYTAQSHAYRPVALIHGVNSDYEEFPELRGWIEQDFPGIETISLDAFNDRNSFPSAVRQISWFGHLLERVSDTYGEVTLLGFSQGGFISRGVIQTSDNPFIHTFISVSAPGQFTQLFKIFLIGGLVRKLWYPQLRGCSISKKKWKTNTIWFKKKRNFVEAKKWNWMGLDRLGQFYGLWTHGIQTAFDGPGPEWALTQFIISAVQLIFPITPRDLTQIH